jgi:hypothetical protein
VRLGSLKSNDDIPVMTAGKILMDNLPSGLGGGGSSCFELDGYGDIQPGTGVVDLMESDANGDLQPKV